MIPEIRRLLSFLFRGNRQIKHHKKPHNPVGTQVSSSHHSIGFLITDNEMTS